MRPWLIETGVDTTGAGRLAKSLRDAGVSVTDVTWLEELDRMPRPPGIFHGAIQTGVTVRGLGWDLFGLTPGYQCTHYYPKFGRLLLNRRYIMVPYGDLFRMRGYIQDLFDDTRVFIRPNSNEKLFSGQLASLDPNQWEATIASHFGGYDPLPPHELVVISPPLFDGIEAEHRSIVVDGKVVSTSTYERAGVLVNGPVSEPKDSPIRAFAQRAVNESGYAPDVVWVLDTCTLKNGGRFVLEVGSFSASSLYGNDTDAIVHALLPALETA